jgi:hypothetical protein
MNGEVFRAYVKQALILELARGDVVVLDNLAAHKVVGVKEAIGAVSASLMYLLALQSWSRSGQTALFRAQGAAAQSGRTHQGDALDHHR